MRGDVLRRIEALEATAEQRKAGLDRAAELDVLPHIAPVYYPLHEAIQRGTYQNYTLPGGRGSGKSSFAALELVSGVMQDPTGETSAIAFRRYAVTLRDSCYSQVAWAVDVLGVGDLWRGTVSPMSYVYTPTGAAIYFRGLDSPEKLKSVRPRRGAFRLIWLEELSELPGSAYMRNVLQSVMRGTDEGFTVLRTYNPPRSKSNWVNVLADEPDERGITLRTTYNDLPREWLGDAFIYEAERLLEVNPTAYQHEYGGEPIGDGADVFGDCLDVRTITDEEVKSLGYIYQGLDFGFSVDPLAFVRMAYDRKHDTIFLLDEIYRRNMGNRELAKEIKRRGYDVKPGGGYVSMLGGGSYEEHYEIIADSAEPKSIQDMRNEGLKVRPCRKYPGCVEYRTRWLQHRRIVIDPARTPNAHREFTRFEYARSRDGEVLASLPDADNHTIDAVAYGLNDLIYGRVSA